MKAANATYEDIVSRHQDACELQVLEHLAENIPERRLPEALLEAYEFAVPPHIGQSLIRKYGTLTVGQALIKARV